MIRSISPLPILTLALVSSCATCNRVGQPPDRDIRFIKCGDPAQLSSEGPYGFGLICGTEGLLRYGLQNGLETFCVSRLPFGSRFDPYSQTCTISMPLAQNHPKGIFCSTQAPALSKVVLRVRDISRGEPGRNSVQVADAVFMYTWNIEGVDTCKRHKPAGHEVDDGLAIVLQRGGPRATRAKQWLQLLHDESWDRLAGIAAAPPVEPDCVALPDDD